MLPKSNEHLYPIDLLTQNDTLTSLKKCELIIVEKKSYVNLKCCKKDKNVNATYKGARNGRSRPPNRSCPDSFLPPRPPPDR